MTRTAPGRKPPASLPTRTAPRRQTLAPWRGRRLTPEALPPEADDREEDEEETGPLRRCIVSRERGERARMIRFVVGPNGEVVPDLAAKLPGRGIWLSARRDMLDTARA